MELTGLKYAINTGTVKKASSLNNTESNSRTLEYKQIKNASQNASLPKFDNGLVSPFQIMTQNGLGSTKNEISAITQGTTNSNTFGGVTDPYSINPNLNATPQKNVQLNSSSKGSGIGVSGVGNVVTSGIQFAGDAINSFSVNETGDEIAKRQGTSDMSIGGIGYESPNMINLNKELERVKKENTGNTLKTVGSGAALGAAAGSIIPGLGTIAGGLIGGAVGLITGIFGGEARKREYRRMLAKQNSMINSLQDSARFSAQTKAIQLQNAREYGNSEAQYLYGAKNGMLPEYNIGADQDKDLSNIRIVKPNEKLADSTFGKTNVYNSYASNGEVAAEDGIIRKLGKGKDNKDTLPFFATKKTSIFPNKGEEKYGMNISDYVWETGDVDGGLLMLNDYKQNMKKNSIYAKNGRLPKCWDGLLSPWAMMQENIKKASENNINRWKNTIAPSEQSSFGGYIDPYQVNPNLNPPTANNTNYKRANNKRGKWYTSWLDDLPYYFNMGSALTNELFRDHRKFAPTTSKRNKHEDALNTLAELRMNPYPIYIANRNAESRTKGGINALGLQAPIKASAFLAAQNNTQRNIGTSLANLQMQNNAYLSDWAKTRYAGGAADRGFGANATWHDQDVLMRSNANDLAWTFQNLSTASKAWQQANKNRFDRNTYRWMMDQYAQDMLV